MILPEQVTEPPFGKAGVSTILVNGIPEDDMPEISSEAVVIALKSRTQNTEEAVADCIKAFQWLIKKRCESIIFQILFYI